MLSIQITSGKPCWLAFFFVAHVNVTRHPTEAWAAQQLREATPFGDGPRYLIRDNDAKFWWRFAAAAEGSSIEIVTVPPRTPNLNAICERFLGSVRRECLDHVVILSERHFFRILRDYVEVYFSTVRPHQGLGQRIPLSVALPPKPCAGEAVAFSILGGLHHAYRMAAGKCLG